MTFHSKYFFMYHLSTEILPSFIIISYYYYFILVITIAENNSLSFQGII